MDMRSVEISYHEELKATTLKKMTVMFHFD